ncbi:helix-turn-helix domain-containing protein [Thalassospira sp.]|uniref:helix-turn-helix domain-containing protein n=1 Tax=Thalassospira sp. TaxID=1912094 RepID=UPI001B1DEB2E|nr:helix-turn-helix domain-containing protein [Thalassospira sp.]MBO6807692.1 helix-turn-helix domain-containing protein [Thalassospira sp.]MBO6840217.1 helix-turn-helix domain-containing protein [Thalassospira sp.]
MSKAGSRILQGARESLALAEGKTSADAFVIHIPEKVDVKSIRKKQGLTQKAFAETYGFSYGRIRDWEQGRSNMDEPSRVLLKVIEKEPEAVRRALADA